MKERERPKRTPLLEQWEAESPPKSRWRGAGYALGCFVMISFFFLRSKTDIAEQDLLSTYGAWPGKLSEDTTEGSASILTRNRTLESIQQETEYFQDAVWVSTVSRIQQTLLAAPFEKYRYTFLHALSEETSEKEEAIRILGFLEETPHPRPSVIDWQTSLPQDMSFIESVACRYNTGGDDVSVPAIRKTTKSPHYPPTSVQHLYQLLCPLPEDIRKSRSNTLEVTLDFRLKGSATTQHTIKLRRHLKAEPETVKGKVGICLAPVHNWSRESAKASIEWRLHHLSLGIETVHWYGRDSTLARHVADLNQHLGVKDTFRMAEYISPETHNTDILMDKGEYADQILYYMDCHLRSRTENPTEWLAFTDLDEFYMPEPFSTNGLSAMLHAQDQKVGAVCLGRTHVSKEAGSLDKSVRMANFTHIRQPQPTDGPDNNKCMYRTHALNLLGVHEPVELAAGYWDAQIRESSTLKLFHFGSHKPFGKGPWEMAYKPTVSTRQYVQDLASLVAVSISRIYEKPRSFITNKRERSKQRKGAQLNRASE